MKSQDKVVVKGATASGGDMEGVLIKQTKNLGFKDYWLVDFGSDLTMWIEPDRILDHDEYYKRIREEYLRNHGVGC